jgi:predicted DCC family thiol-disulfide oxidoreductase YuxK
MSDGPRELPRHLFLFDGVCGLCDGLVRFTVGIDRQRRFRYAPLQGSTAEALRARYPEIPKDLDTMVFVDDGVVYLRAKGVSRAARYLPWPWRLAYGFFFLPAWLTDPLYRLVARTRYRVFGVLESCRLPEPHERELFLP